MRGRVVARVETGSASAAVIATDRGLLLRLFQQDDRGVGRVTAEQYVTAGPDAPEPAAVR